MPPTIAPTTPSAMSMIMPEPVLLTILLAIQPAIRPRMIQLMIAHVQNSFSVGRLSTRRVALATLDGRSGPRIVAGWTGKTQAGSLRRLFFDRPALSIRAAVCADRRGRLQPEEEAMGMFDDALKNAVPGGNLATPIAVAVGRPDPGQAVRRRLRAGAGARALRPRRRSVPTNVPPGSVLGGLATSSAS